MRTFEVALPSATYKGTTASARNQIEALHICMGHAAVAALLRPQSSEQAVVVALAALEYTTIEHLAALVLKENIVRAEDQAPVGQNLFQDAPQEWYLLLARVLQENLAGFWQLRRPEPAAAKAAEPGTSTTS